MYYLKTGNINIKYYKLPELTKESLEKIVIDRFLECMSILNVSIINITLSEDSCYTNDYCFEVSYQYNNKVSTTVTTCTICFDEVTKEEYIEKNLLE